MNRLKQLRESKELLQSDIADLLEMSSVGYGYYETEKRIMPITKAQKLAEFYNVTVDYLLGKDAEKGSIYMVKVYERISAGLPNWGDNQCIGVLPVDPVIMNISDIENCFFVKVSGESMNKVIANGSYALIRKTEYVENNDIAVVLVNGEATIKKFIKKENVILLEPMSTDSLFSTQIYTEKDDIKVIGKYIGKFELN